MKLKAASSCRHSIIFQQLRLCGTTMMATAMSMLLCLLYALVDVNSQTVPYISFMGTNLPNHSYVNLTLVGDDLDGTNSVQCHTDLTTCCTGIEGSAQGHWYFPTGLRLPSVSLLRSGLFQIHGTQRVDLRRHESGVTTGIYSCDIGTTAVNNGARETVYVGLYTTGGDVTVESEIRLAVDSDPNGKASLTCTSSGGPATSVVWTRDSEEVSGGMTVLRNAETAEYVHTLTLTERLGGLYQCVVSNNKPSQDSASITLQAASAPTNLMAVQEGPTGIRASWTPPTPLGDTTGYTIYYSGGSSGSVDVSGGFTDHKLLTNLQNGANYIISIVGRSQHLPSDLVNYPTSIPLIPDMLSAVMVTSTTATTISLSWTVSRGSVGTYELVWERDTSGKCPDNDNGRGTTTDGSTKYTIAGLEEDSTYTITVTIINAAGSAVSDPVTGKTAEAAPSAPPSSVGVANVTTSSITVQWEDMDCIQHNGNITGYSVQYGILNFECSVTLSVSGAATTEATLYGLINNVMYSIAVAAVNSGGIGVYSRTIIVEIEGDACPQTEGCEYTAAVGGGVVGGFVGGVLISAMVAAVISGVCTQKLRTKASVSATSSGMPREQKSTILTSANLAYGDVKRVRAAEYEICDTPSGAARPNEAPTYETVLT